MRLCYRYARVLLLVVAITLPCIVIIKFIHNFIHKHEPTKDSPSYYESQVIRTSDVSETNQQCRFHSCFNLFQCKPRPDWRIKVYVYPNRHYETSNKQTIFPKQYEFEAIIEAIRQSKYSTNNISEACLFIPSVDLLTEKGLDLKIVSAVLKSLPR